MEAPSEIASEDECDEDVKWLDSSGTGIQRNYSAVTKSAERTRSSKIMSIKRLIYGVQASVGAFSACIDKQDARFEGIAKAKPGPAPEVDQKKRMLSGADFRNRKSAGRDGRKDTTLELKRLKILCANLKGWAWSRPA